MVRRTRTNEIVESAQTSLSNPGTFDGLITYYDSELGFEIARAFVTAVDGENITIDGGHLGFPVKTIPACNIAYIDHPARS